MSDILTKIVFFIALVIILLPFTYLWHFFIEYLPRKYGYFKFILIIFCYLSILALGTFLISEMALGTFLLSEVMIGIIIFFSIPIILLLIGVLFFKDEIKHELKWELKGRINNNE